jgi:hypothetical protein
VELAMKDLVQMIVHPNQKPCLSAMALCWKHHAPDAFIIKAVLVPMSELI